MTSPDERGKLTKFQLLTTQSKGNPNLTRTQDGDFSATLRMVQARCANTQSTSCTRSTAEGRYKLC